MGTLNKYLSTTEIRKHDFSIVIQNDNLCLSFNTRKLTMFTVITLISFSTLSLVDITVKYVVWVRKGPLKQIKVKYVI